MALAGTCRSAVTLTSASSAPAPANSIIDDRFDHLSVALVEMGTFGGTCLNVGCIPSKMFVYPADLAGVNDQANRLGVDLDAARCAVARDPGSDLRPD